MSLNQKIIYILLISVNSNMVIAQTCQTATHPTTPSSRFIVRNNGTVTDRKTGLMWKQCSEGLSGADCSVGEIATYTWQGALQQAQAVNANGGFASYTDWRVPNVKELRSIIERQCVNPAINLTVFPNTAISYSDYFSWSSTSFAYSLSNAWMMNFDGGSDSNGYKPDYVAVRLVRGR